MTSDKYFLMPSEIFQFGRQVMMSHWFARLDALDVFIQVEREPCESKKGFYLKKGFVLKSIQASTCYNLN